MLSLRIAYVAILVSVGLVRFFWHRKAEILKAGETDVPEGGPIWVARLVLMPLWGISIIGWPIHPPWFAFQELPFNEPIRWVGVAIAVAGVGVLAWVHKTLGENFSPFLRIRENHQLVENCPYRWVRHPMYTSFALIFLGPVILTASSVRFVVAAMAMGAIAVRTRQEEAMLIERFGDSYREYRNRTGALFPRIFPAS